MIRKEEIMVIADETGLVPTVVEKDYVLGHLLAGIFENKIFQETWSFKGGTCLKKCFFETYRFSEDLDFTLSDQKQLEKDFLNEQFSAISELLYDKTGITFPPERFVFDIYQNKREKPACEGRIYYESYFASGKKSLPKIKLDLTADEILVMPSASQSIIHNYSDNNTIGNKASCYRYAELFAEKIRAMAERGRPRDLYDIVNMYRNDELPSSSVIRDILAKKCQFKSIAIPTMETIEAYRPDIESNWEPMLKHQLPELPSIEVYWQVLPEFFSWLEGHAVPKVAALASVPGTGQTYRPAYGHLRLRTSQGKSLEIIRFAAGNRLCVDLSYDGSIRRIESYSLRRTKAGDILLYAVKRRTGEIRAYRIDRIEAATVTNEVFIPRYQIELSQERTLSA